MSLITWHDQMEYHRLINKAAPLTKEEREWLGDYLTKEKLEQEEWLREDVNDSDERDGEDDADQG